MKSKFGGAVIGDKELLRAMSRINAAAVAPTVDSLALDALEPMREATEANAVLRRQEGATPPGGHLDQGVVTAKVGRQSRTTRTFWVTFRKRAIKIAHLVEFGTAPHAQPRRGIMHPGARPFPFMRPAFESTKKMVIDRFGKNVWAVIRGETLHITSSRRRKR